MIPGQYKWRYLLQNLFMHLLLWLLIMGYLAWGVSAKTGINAIAEITLYLPGFFLIFYSLFYFFIPRYLVHLRITAFFAGLAVTFGLSLLYNFWAAPAVGMQFMLKYSVIIYFQVAGIAVILKLLLLGYQQKKLTNESEEGKALAELQLLKAQLHPHFLFNALNNLYSHTLEGSSKSPEIVMKLAELLQFMIYESESSKIPLVKEINLLKNYIALEKLCCDDRIDISFTTSGEIENYQIAPLLLLPFLENSFKHGTGINLEQCWMSMDVWMNGPELHFRLINGIEPGRPGEEGKNKGMGLKNVKKRLKILYRNKFSLVTERHEEVFVANLRVTLEPLEKQIVEKEYPEPVKTAVT